MNQEKITNIEKKILDMTKLYESSTGEVRKFLDYDIKELKRTLKRELNENKNSEIQQLNG